MTTRAVEGLGFVTAEPATHAAIRWVARVVNGALKFALGKKRRSMKQKKKHEKSTTRKSHVLRVPDGKPPLIPRYRQTGSKEVTAAFKAGKELEA